MKNTPEAVKDIGGQAGSGILSVVAVLGLILLLVQGTNFYRARESAKFLNTEKNKVLAMQLAEAGVEENIADLGNGTRVVTAGMADVVTYDHKVLEDGNYTSRLSTVGMGTGTLPDTVDMVSSGVVGAVRQTIQARLRLNKTAITTTLPPPLPAATPQVTTTPEYTACLSNGLPSCKVCHLMSPGVYVVLSVPKGFIPGHNVHVGDYLVPDITVSCTRYTVGPTVTTTGIKVQILAWK